MVTLARRRGPFVAALVAALVAAAGASGPAPAPNPKRVTVRFSPRGGCAALVAWHVDQAKSEIVVASYQWSSRPVHDAVVRAKARGVRVRVVLDPGMERSASSLLPGLIAAGFTGDEVRVDPHHAIFHDKVILRDPRDPLRAAHENGSFNYSLGAETSNAENAQVVEGFPEVTAAYLADLERHWSHARPAVVTAKGKQVRAAGPN